MQRLNREASATKRIVSVTRNTAMIPYVVKYCPTCFYFPLQHETMQGAEKVKALEFKGKGGVRAHAILWGDAYPFKDLE